jgi:tRNA pseudouridine55 synthase
VDAVLLCDKPAGCSSHDVVAAVRRTLPPEPGGRRRGGGRPRVGHAGTLDPFATGLLLVLIGRAARLQRLLMALPKRYEVVARLGASSSTGDPEGEITLTGRIPPDPPPLPTGEVRQRPPAYSAVHVDGERAYVLARRGEVVEMPERVVHVDRFEQQWRAGERAAFLIECSSGTYVRSLIADLGDAYCEQLRRTAIGPFRVSEAIAPPRSDQPPSWCDSALTLQQALTSFIPSVELTGDPARRASHGSPVPDPGGERDGPVVLLDERGVVAVAEPAPGGLLRPVIGLRPS